MDSFEHGITVVRNAYTRHVNQLEEEVHEAQRYLSEKDETISALHKRLEELENALHAAQTQTKELSEQKESLIFEKNDLENTVQKLDRECQKLRLFKSAVAESFRREDDFVAVQNQGSPKKFEGSPYRSPHRPLYR